MHKQLLLIVLACFASLTMAEGAFAEGESYPHSGADIDNLESLQRGSRNFMNYCSGCHSLKYVRYNRMAADLRIPEATLAGNLMYGDAKPYDTIGTSMPTDSVTWFGKQPPDLSLMARARSVDYIYAFLKGFYVDKTRLWGVNNQVLPGAAMPDVVAQLQGLQKPVYKNETVDGTSSLVLVGVEAMTPGTMKPEEYDQFARDTANFLDYAAEPVKAKRQSMGIFVTLFLLVFFVFAWMLKKEYWKDIH